MNSNAQPCEGQSLRQGVTLTEVLMSLMIMSIGVASVATLFPIAALRSAQATKLTNAAILKYNIEAFIEARPELIFDPDGDFTGSNFGAITEHFRRNSEKNYIVDPFGYFLMAGMNPDPTNLVGPIGAGTDANRQFADYFGNIAFDSVNGTGAPFGPTQTGAPLQRYDGGIRAVQNQQFSGVLTNDTLPAFEAIASELANLGDGWDTVVDEVALGPVTNAGGAIVGVTLDSEVDLTALVSSQQYFTALNAGSVTIRDPEFTKITVFSTDGRFSNSFPLTQVSGVECRWDEPADLNGNGIVEPRGLPGDFGGAVGRVLIQTRRSQDFNWMLTVRREADARASGVDVVVMFSGGRSPDHERVFPATFTAGAFGVIVAKTSGTDLNGDAAEPFLKRGGFVLDVLNARWYRVANYQDNPADATTHLVTLESAAVESSSVGAVFLPGVVDVYPLGSFPIPPEMLPPTF